MNYVKAHGACLLIVFIWSGWITISRYGVQSSLEPADITLIRYVTALLGISPLLVTYRFSRFRLHQYLVVGLGIGFPYTMVSFYGLQEVKAAHAGVLVNGMLPIFGAIAAWFLLSQRVSLIRYFSIFILFLANFIMAGGDTFSATHLGGMLLLLAAAIIYTIHMVSVKLWRFEWRDVVVAVPLVNVILFLPLWFLFPSNLMQAKMNDILSQAFYQGILVNIFALMCATFAIKYLGPITVSIYMSAVPVTTALLAWLLLGEALNGYELVGIAGCSLGLFIYGQSQVWEKRGRVLR